MLAASGYCGLSPDQSGATICQQITDRILDSIDKLEAFPEMGIKLPGKRLVGYPMLVVNRYLCFYHIDGDTVYVSHIVHSGTDYIKRLFPENLDRESLAYQTGVK